MSESLLQALFVILLCTSIHSSWFTEQLLLNLARRSGETQLDHFRRGQCTFCPYIDYCSSISISLGDGIGIQMPENCKYCDTCGNDDLCTMYGDCCSYKVMKDERENGVCAAGIVNHDTEDTGIKMIARCPNSYNDIVIKEKCETKIGNLHDDDILKPVTSGRTRTYRNKYCAFCNNVTQFTTWDIADECAESFSLPSTMTYKEVLDKIWNHDRCNVTLVKPEILNESDMRQCTIIDKQSLVSSCNVTGHWLRYDKDIEDACLTYNNLFLRQYKNVFCFLCNSKELTLPVDSQCSGGTSNRVNIFTSFSTILNFNAGSDENRAVSLQKEVYECERGFQFDIIKMQCVEIHCPDGWWYTGNKCEKVVHIDEVLQFEIKTIFRLESPLEYENCNGSYSGALYAVVDKLRYQIHSPYLDRFRSSEEYGLVDTRWAECSREEPNTNDTNMLASFSVAMVQSLHGIKMAVGYTMKNDIDVNFIGDTVLNRFLKTYEVRLHDGRTITLIPDSDWTFTFQQNGDILSTSGQTLDDQMLGLTRPSVLRPQPDRVVAFSRLLYCPYVILNSSEVEISQDGKELKILATNSSVGYYNFRATTKMSSVQICSDQYISNITGAWDTTATAAIQNDPTVQEILSLSCTCLSVLCLFITFIIYCIFSSLRTLAGMNNMSLAFTLMIAQVLYQFGAGQTNEPLVCEIIGLFAHYFWLVAVLWMNICCLHMFRIFGRKIVSITDRKGNFRTYAKYLVYCLCVPVVFIIINIVTNIVTRGDSKMGYMGDVCFITSQLMLGVTFALPVAMVITINIVLFLIVVISISRQAKASSLAAVDRQYVHVYFRLSTITGITWVFGFLYQWTLVETFSYLFVVLNALQGVFIFIAFICNKNVFQKIRTHVPISSSS